MECMPSPPSTEPVKSVWPAGPIVPGAQVPRLWSGAAPRTWGHRWGGRWRRVAPRCWPWLLGALALTPVHWGLGGMQRLFWDRRVAAAGPGEAPVFVIGHWRSGTSLLHELLALDANHAAPLLFECARPLHFLMTGGLVRNFLSGRKPGPRPMDEMQVGLTSPGEDEIALMMAGAVSPYLRLPFPNDAFDYREALDVRRLPEDELRRWKQCPGRFHRNLSYRHRLRMIYKSPTHSARMELLLEMFPGARFACINREPEDVFGSMRKLVRVLAKGCTFEKLELDEEQVEEMILGMYEFLQERMEEGRAAVPAGQFHELSYEDLVADPVAGMKALYEGLNLDGFEAMKPAVEGYFEEREALS